MYQELRDLCRSLRIVIEDKFSVMRMAGDEEWMYSVVICEINLGWCLGFLAPVGEFYVHSFKYAIVAYFQLISYSYPAFCTVGK